MSERAISDDQERSLRYLLSMLALAAVIKEEGNLAKCTERILDKVSDFVEDARKGRQ